MINRYIFGPVPSRRLGSSLGIDIIPSKTCQLDCIYCEVGKTTELTCARKAYFDADEVVSEFRREYEKVKDTLDVVTITGSGEPTLNTDFAYIAAELKKISEHPLAILTNSTSMTDENVRKGLMLFDIIVPSIDAASPDVFKKINKPAPGLDIEKINEALVSFTHEFKGRLYPEVLIVKDINDKPEEMAKIAAIINRCRYERVQVNTVFRPPAYSGVKGLSEEELIGAFLFFKEAGLKVEPVGNFIKSLSPAPQELLGERTAALLRMRPCTAKDIALVFSADEGDVAQVLNTLLSGGAIEEKKFKGESFYFGKH